MADEDEQGGEQGGEGAAGGGEGAGGEGEQGGEGERSFSQADLDRIVQDRVARERKKYEGHDELRKKAEEYDRLQAEQQTELERERAAREQAERERDAERAEVREARLRGSLLAEAAKPERRIADPEAAVLLLDRAGLELDDDGYPTNAEKAVDSLLEQRPFLVLPEGAGGSRRDAADQGARRRADAGSLEDLTDPAKVREAVKGLRA